MMGFRQTFRILGPGLLYAGAAVGVSHLVQSTRAGASYGFELLWILILANAIKYPFFEFAPRYAIATGNHLIEGYGRLGKWAVVLFALLTLLTMFSIQAAVTVVTAGIAGNVFGLSIQPQWLSAWILLITFIILVLGRFSILDKLIKLVIVALALSTVMAVISATMRGNGIQAGLSGTFSWIRREDIFFLIAFVGWMPAPIDVAVWQSLWTNAKSRQLGFTPTMRQGLLDFKIGYIGTALLSICFLSLGALVMYGSGEDLSSAGDVFAGQLIRMYTQSMGSWAYPVIAIAALTTMFSTTLTCLDAYPRVMTPLTALLFTGKDEKKDRKTDWSSWLWMAAVVAGAILLLSLLSNSMRFMVDLATTLSFVTAPILAFMNYRVVTDRHMPEKDRPPAWLRIYAWAGIIFLTAFTLFYLYWRLMR